MTTGEKLTALRQHRSMTQEDFCKSFNKRYPSLSITRWQYARWETDSRNMQLDHFKAVVLFYRISADDLLFNDRIPGNIIKNKSKKTSYA